MTEKILIINLLNDWCISKGRYGITVPYLIGYLKLYHDKSYDLNHLCTFLTQNDQLIQLNWCEDLYEFIIGYKKAEDTPLNMLPKIGNLHFQTEKVSNHVKNESELLQWLIERYSDPVENENYSRNIDLEEWEPFSIDDEKYMEKIAIVL